MKYTAFPKSGRKISQLGFGAMGFANWFGEQPEREHIDALHGALELGVNFIDTARAYGDSERIVGVGLKEWSGDPPFVATKIQALGPDWQWGSVVPVEVAYPKGQVRASCERSLKELGLDRVDLIQLHVYWPVWGNSGYWMDELQTLKEEGKARFIGISVPDHRSDMVLPLVQSGLIDSVQTIVNIFDPLAYENLIPICAENNVAVIARCVLDEGGLTGTLSGTNHFAEGDFRHHYFDGVVPLAVYLDKVDALRRFIPEHAGSLAALALKFATHRPEVTTAISSMHVREYAEMNVAAMDEPPLSEDVFRELMTRHRFTKNFSEAKHWPRDR